MSDRRVGFDPDLGYMADLSTASQKNGRTFYNQEKRRDDIRIRAAACFRA